MLIVKVNGKKQIEKALKELKYKVHKTGLITELRERKRYIKPTTKKRELMQKAIYIDKKQNNKT